MLGQTRDYQLLLTTAMEEQKWMNYVGVTNDGVVVGRSLVMFILKTEGSTEEKELW